MEVLIVMFLVLVPLVIFFRNAIKDIGYNNAEVQRAMRFGAFRGQVCDIELEGKIKEYIKDPNNKQEIEEQLKELQQFESFRLGKPLNIETRNGQWYALRYLLGKQKKVSVDDIVQGISIMQLGNTKDQEIDYYRKHDMALWTDKQLVGLEHYIPLYYNPQGTLRNPVYFKPENAPRTGYGYYLWNAPIG